MKQEKYIYRVLQPGFFDGVYHQPNDPRHNLVKTEKPLDPVPSWLEEIKGKAATTAEEQAEVERELSKTEAAQVGKSKKEAAAVSFAQPSGQNGVTKL